MGTPIDGTDENDGVGTSIALSADGRVLAVGADNDDPLDDNGATMSNAGHVRVYVWDDGDPGAWQLRADLPGKMEGAYSGTDVALSANGDVIAVGEVYHEDPHQNQGRVRVYDWNGVDTYEPRADPQQLLYGSSPNQRWLPWPER